MKIFKGLLKHYVWGFAILCIVANNTTLWAMDGSITSIKENIETISKSTDLESQASKLTSLLQVGSTTPLDSTTQKSLADLIAIVFNSRMKYYKAGTQFNTSKFNLFLGAASQSTMLTPAQQEVIHKYDDLDDVEEVLVQNQTELDFSDQVDALSSALRSAGIANFDPFFQDLAFKQLTAVFDKRTAESSAQLSIIFGLVPKSALLNSVQKKQIAPMFVTTTLEKILAITNPAERIAALQEFTTNNSTLTPEQQTTLKAGLQALTNPLPTDATILGNLSKMLGSLSSGGLAQLATSFLPQVGTALTAANLQVALAITDPVARIAALQNFMSNNPNVALSPNQQSALQSTLQALADNPPTDLAALGALTKVLSGLGSSALSPEAQAQLAGKVSTALNAANIDAALKAALTTADPAARIVALQQFMSSNPNVVLTAEEKSALQSSLEALANNPPTDQATLAALAKVLTSSSLLSPEAQAQMSEKVTTAIATVKMNEALQGTLAINDPAARITALQNFTAENPNATLSPAMQTAMQSGLQALANNPPLDPVVLASLAKVLGGLGSSALAPEAQAQITEKVNAALAVANMKAELQAALAITDPAARVAALQKFVSNNASAALSPELQTELQTGLKALVRSLPNNPAALENLATMLSEITGSKLLSPAFTKQLTNKILPAIKKAEVKAEKTALLLEATSKVLTKAQTAAQATLDTLTAAQAAITTEASPEQLKQAINTIKNAIKEANIIEKSSEEAIKELVKATTGKKTKKGDKPSTKGKKSKKGKKDAAEQKEDKPATKAKKSKKGKKDAAEQKDGKPATKAKKSKKGKKDAAEQKDGKPAHKDKKHKKHKKDAAEASHEEPAA